MDIGMSARSTVNFVYFVNLKKKTAKKRAAHQQKPTNEFF